MTVHPSGKKLYASVYVGTKGVTQYTVDPAGTLSQNLSITTGVGTSPAFVGVEPKGRSAYVIDDAHIHRLNIDTCATGPVPHRFARTGTRETHAVLIRYAPTSTGA